MKNLTNTELIRWFNTYEDTCPYCKNYLDWQCTYVEDKLNPTTNYFSGCNCDWQLQWMITEDNTKKNNKVIAVDRVC